MNHAILFIWVLLGHCLGDYWFQNDSMARTKSKPGWGGFIACTKHVTIYTLSIMAMIGCAFWQTNVPHVPWLFLFIFIPHWVIDRYSLAAIWMEWKNGVHPWKVWQSEPPNSLLNLETEKRLEQNAWNVAFTAFVYIVSDNSLHLLCLWLTILCLL
jgi:hypothetical protein